MSTEMFRRYSLACNRFESIIVETRVARRSKLSFLSEVDTQKWMPFVSGKGTGPRDNDQLRGSRSTGTLRPESTKFYDRVFPKLEKTRSFEIPYSSRKAATTHRRRRSLDSSRIATIRAPLPDNRPSIVVDRIAGKRSSSITIPLVTGLEIRLPP